MTNWQRVPIAIALFTAGIVCCYSANCQFGCRKVTGSAGYHSIRIPPFREIFCRKYAGPVAMYPIGTTNAVAGQKDSCINEAQVEYRTCTTCNTSCNNPRYPGIPVGQSDNTTFYEAGATQCFPMSTRELDMKWCRTDPHSPDEHCQSYEFHDPPQPPSHNP